jgi:hypothetical protein
MAGERDNGEDSIYACQGRWYVQGYAVVRRLEGCTAGSAGDGSGATGGVLTQEGSWSTAAGSGSGRR